MSKHQLSRRSMFQWAGFTAAAVATGACRPSEHHNAAFNLALDKPPVPGMDRFSTHEERWVNTSCAQCPAGCGIRVRVVEGRAVRIEGNPTNPLNRGGIGPRGLAGLQALYDADRITGPMVRTGGQLAAAPWEQAIKQVVDKLSDLRTKKQAHRVVVMSGRERGMVHELWHRFCDAYGTPNFVESGRSTVMSQAMKDALGTYTIPAFDWGGAGFVLSMEAGLLEDSCQSVYFTRVAAELRRGRGGGRARIVHLGATFDLSAYNADEWIQIVPGTSGAVALGIAHLLVKTGRFDRNFVHDHATGFDECATALENYTPAKVAAITGLTEATIERLANEVADARAAFAIVDERSTSFSNGVGTAHAALTLNALVGAIGRAEGGMTIEPTPPFADWPAVKRDEVALAGLAQPRVDGAGTAAFPLSRGVHEALPDALLGPNPPEVLILFHANPAWARAQPKRWREALAKVPLIISFSPFRDETVDEFAHVVLPDHSYLERWEDAGAAPGTGKPVAGIRRPVVEPMYDTRASSDVLLAIARGIGGAVADSLPWPTFTKAMEARLIGLFDSHRGATDGKNAAQRAADNAKGIGSGQPVVADKPVPAVLDAGAAVSRGASSRGARELLDQIYTDGFWADLDAPAEPVAFRFNATWQPPQWDGDPASFPLALVVYRPLGFSEGSGANQPWLRHLRTLPGQRPFAAPVSMNPADAPGFHEDDEIEVTSPYGAVSVRVRLDHRVKPGTLMMPLGGGHTAMGRWAKGVGVNPMQLVKSGPAAGSGANAICTTRVRVARKGKA